jgi:hypothetical protein
MWLASARLPTRPTASPQSLSGSRSLCRCGTATAPARGWHVLSLTRPRFRDRIQYQEVEPATAEFQLRLSGWKNRNAARFEQFAAHHYMEKTVMTQLKILTTAAALLVSLASTPVFAQTAPFYGPRGGQGFGPAPYYGQNWSYDNSGWNGYNNGGYNNTWFDGRTYRSDPRPPGEDIAADPAGGAPFRGYPNDYGGSYASMGGDENAGLSDQASCEQRYKSFDPASGTYRGHDGKRHACR